MIPLILQYPSDPLEITSRWRLISEQMFDELLALLKTPDPPAAATLLAEFEKWGNFTPVPGPNVVDKTTGRYWLDAYACALEKNATSRPSYVAATSRLLMQTGEVAEVPIVVAWQNGAVILKLELVSVTGGSGELWFHPSFAHRQTDLSAGTGQFTDALAGAWSQVRSSLPTPAASDFFWRLLAVDGHALPAMQLDGPSASAAALRAFWHLARGMKIDPDVYVLADATSLNGRLEAVGHLRQKIDSIRSIHSTLSGYPPTLVATSTLPADNLASLRSANSWAEVVRVGTVEDMIAVRSCTASAVIAYLEHLAEKLDETPWTWNGKPVRLSDVHVPPQVWKDEYSFHPATGDGIGGNEQDWRPAGYDPAGADREVTPRLLKQKPKVCVPWIKEFRRPQLQPIVIVGGPGFGKTSLLRWTAREIVLESLAIVRARTKAWSEVRWPIITDLAAWLSKSGDSHDTLRDAALDFAPLPKTHPKLQRLALPQVVETRLVTKTEHTHLFLDALDQVPAAQLRLLCDRLGALGTVAPRLVFSTREAALTTHLPKLSIPRLTKLEAAALSTEDASALAARWLDAKLAKRLEAHLRAQPAMSVVADSPLLLTLACGIIGRSSNAELPETAAFLYRDLMQSLARGEWRDAGTDAGHDPDALLARLRPMAWRLFSREAGVNRFSRNTMIRSLNDGSSSADAQADAALNQLCHLGFLEGSGHSQGEPHYQFRHTTFLEFLAASHLSTEINAHLWPHAQVQHWHPEHGWQPQRISEILDAQAFEPAWEPVIVFTAGLMPEPLPLVEMLANRQKDDLYRHRLGLLCKCCGGISSDKEVPMLVLLQSVVKQMERIGSRAVRRRPERWKRWLENFGCLLALPHTSRPAITILIDLASGRHEMKMHGDHEVCDLLARRASTMNYRPALDGLLALCTGELEGHAHADIAKALVECAENNGANEYVHKLSALLETLTSVPTRQVAIAGGLLVSRDADVIDQAIDFLKGKAQDWSAEEWVRSSAIHTLINLLGRGQELKAAAFLIEALFNPASFQYHHGYGNTFASDIVIATERRPSDFGMALTLLILRTCGKDMRLRRYCGEALAVATDPGIRRIGLGVLRELMCHIQKDGCNDADHLVGIDAAKSLAKLGGEEDKTEATEFLWFLTDLPIKDGYNQYFAIEALLETGIPYGLRMHEIFVRCANCETTEPRRVAYMGAMAREHGDHEFVRLISHRLEWLVEVAKPSHTSKEPGPFDRDIAARGLFGTEHWKSIEESAFARLYESVHEDSHADWFAVDTVSFGAKSSAIIALIPELIRSGKMDFRPWHKLMRELDKRGWRLRLHGRQIEVLRRGQEEPRADADFGY